MNQLLLNEIRNDLIITAIEGGSNYWYFLDEKAYDIIKKYKGIKKDFHGNYFSGTFSEAILTAIMEDRKILIYDIENENEVLGCLSKNSIEKGEEIMYTKYPQHFANILSENWDAETADVWFQLCVMGELVYG